MPTSKLDIANLALEKLGQSVTIAAFEENTKHGKAIARAWDRVRDFVLADRPWQFATVAKPGELLTETAFPGWQRHYAYPADCLYLFAVTTANGARIAMQQVMNDTIELASPGYEYELSRGEQATSVNTDIEDAYFVFTSIVTDTARYPAKFVEALACRLAWDRAGAIAGEAGLQMRPQLMQDYLLAVSEASTRDRNEANDAFDYYSPTLASRA